MTMNKHPRGRIERWLDRHNHKMELIRTIVPVLVLILQAAMFFAFFSPRQETRIIQQERVVIKQPNCFDCHGYPDGD